MSIITVIAAQASLYYSQLITALGLTGATAMGQAFVLTMLAVVSILTVVAAAAAIYYGAKGISHGFIKLNSWWKSDKTKIPSKKKTSKSESENDDVESDIDSDLESDASISPKEAEKSAKPKLKKKVVPELGSDSESASKSEKRLPPKKSLTPAKKDSEVADPDLVYLKQMDAFLNQFITDVENFNSSLAANKEKLDNTEYKKVQKEVKALISSKDNRTSERLDNLKKIQETLVKKVASILEDANKKDFKDFVGGEKYEVLAIMKPIAKDPEEVLDLGTPLKPKIKIKDSENTEKARTRKQPSRRKFCDKPADQEVVNSEEAQKIAAYYEVFAKTLEPKLFKGLYEQAQKKNAFIFYHDKGEIKLYCKKNFFENYTVLLARAEAKVLNQEPKPDVVADVLKGAPQPDVITTKEAGAENQPAKKQKAKK